MPRFLICSAREIRDYAWIQASSPKEAEKIARADDFDGWDDDLREDNDSGEIYYCETEGETE